MGGFVTWANICWKYWLSLRGRSSSAASWVSDPIDPTGVFPSAISARIMRRSSAVYPKTRHIASASNRSSPRASKGFCT